MAIVLKMDGDSRPQSYINWQNLQASAFPYLRVNHIGMRIHSGGNSHLQLKNCRMLDIECEQPNQRIISLDDALVSSTGTENL